MNNQNDNATAAPQPSAVPDGFKLVPIEPTPEMLDVDEEVGGNCYSCTKWKASAEDCRRVWGEMLAASPTPPAVVAGAHSPNYVPADIEAMNARQAETIKDLRAQLAAQPSQAPGVTPEEKRALYEGLVFAQKDVPNFTDGAN